MNEITGQASRTICGTHVGHSYEIALTLDSRDKNNESSEGQHEDEESESSEVDEEEEKSTYDPVLIKRGVVAWLDQGHVLGFNVEAVGVTNAFFSGRGQYNSYSSFRIEEPGDDPNDPNRVSIHAMLQAIQTCSQRIHITKRV